MLTYQCPILFLFISGKESDLIVILQQKLTLFYSSNKRYEQKCVF